MEELSKIKYSIEGMVRKRENLQMKESIEAKFAHTLNQIITGDSPEMGPNFKYEKKDQDASPLMSKLQQYMRVDINQRVADTELHDVYKQIKALELKSKCTVTRDFRKLPGHINQYSPSNKASPQNQKVRIENVDEDEALQSEHDIEEDNPP